MFGNQAQDFENQMLGFKNQLLALYKKRTKLTAERESLRFQYVTNFKGQLSNVIASIFDQAYKDRNVEGEELIRILLGLVMQGIPMFTLNGGTVQGWSNNFPGNLGGDKATTLISPMPQLILDKDYYGKSAAEYYGPAWSSQGAEGILASYWMHNTSDITRDSVQNWIEQVLVYRPEVRERFESQVPYAVDLLTRTYTTGSLQEVVGRLRSGLLSILEDTLALMLLQREVVGVEEQVTAYANDYSSYSGSAYDTAALLKDLQDAATGSEDALIRLGLQEAPVGATTVTDSSQDVVGPVEAMPVKSKLPWIAAGAVALFALTRK